ncbi:MAG: DUF5675 family protein [Bacteroidales bacterium]|nr:DUF5675 family protein [Bacteroidales bacterium]
MSELNIYTKREIKRDGYTISKLRMDESGYFCDILEPTDRGLTQDMSEAEIKAKKVKGKTAIPTGRYEVIWAYSPRLHAKSYAKPYGGKFPCIIGIKGFSGVLIHPGATKADTEACLLPGMHTSTGRVTDSQKAYKDFMDFYFVPAMKRGDKCFINIE